MGSLPLSGSADSGILPRSVGTRGGLSSRLAALPHSLAVPAAAISARFQVGEKLSRVAARLGAWIAVQRFEEVQLSNPVRLHADHHGVEPFGDVRKPFRVLRNA